MSKTDKLIDELKRQPSPKDFSWASLVKVLAHFGYKEIQGSGSRVKFVATNNHKILLHKRHPDSTLLDYQIEQVVDALKQEGHLK